MVKHDGNCAEGDASQPIHLKLFGQLAGVTSKSNKTATDQITVKIQQANLDLDLN